MGNAIAQEFTISIATDADVEGILNVTMSVVSEGLWLGTELPLDRDAWRIGFQSTVRRDDALALVATADHTVIGEATLSPKWPGLLQLGMSVDAAWRSQGVGASLLARAVTWARNSKAHKISLEVFPHNTSALSLYEKYGFVQEGAFRHHIRRRSGELWDLIPMGLLLCD
jgi:putative acetyltransferase